MEIEKAQIVYTIIRTVNAEKYTIYPCTNTDKKKRRQQFNMYMQKLHTYSIWQAYRFVLREPVQDFPLLLLLCSSLYLSYLSCVS